MEQEKIEAFKAYNEEVRRSKGLVISRLPEPTRSEFIKFAEDNFAGDYGMTLLTLWDSFKKSMLYFDNSEVKLNYIIQMLENQTHEEKPETTKGIRLLSGRIVGKKEVN